MISGDEKADISSQRRERSNNPLGLCLENSMDGDLSGLQSMGCERVG